MTPTDTELDRQLKHILGTCGCDRLDMNCWFMRNNDPEFIEYLPEKQETQLKQLIAREWLVDKQERVKRNKSLCGCPMCLHHTAPYELHVEQTLRKEVS